MTTVRVLIGDVLGQLANIAAGSCDLVFTSSPFFGLRAYLPVNHPWKHLELGQEATPGEFIDALLYVVERLAVVLAPHGSIMWELGDSMAGSGGHGGDYEEGGLRAGQEKFAGTASQARGVNGVAYGRAAGEPPRPPRSLSQRPKYNGERCDTADRGRPDRKDLEWAGVMPAKSHTHRDVPGWPLEKSLCMIPELFRVALAYGFNPLTGRQHGYFEGDPGLVDHADTLRRLDSAVAADPRTLETEGLTWVPLRWRVRNVVRWARNNPVVGSLGRRNVETGMGDARYRPATSDLVVFCRDRGRYFDLDAVRSEPATPTQRDRPFRYPDEKPVGRNGQPAFKTTRVTNPAGSPPLDHWWFDDDVDRWAFDDDDVYRQDTWLVNTRPYRGSHYAVMPVDLPVIPIRSMCPERVCVNCGRPSERIVSTRRSAAGPQSPYQVAARKPGHWAQAGRDVGTSTTTLGWSECGCGDGCEPTTWEDVWVPEVDDDGAETGGTVKVRVVQTVGRCADPGHWRPGMVLDPFGGSGTTAVVAQRLGRDCTIIDLDDRNVQLIHDRVLHDLVLPDDAPVVLRAQLDLFSTVGETP